MPRVAVNGVHLDYEEAGIGRPILLLHGFTGRGSSWLSFAESWPGFRLIAPDLIGHGNSDSPPGLDHYRMDSCCDDLAALLDHLGIEKAVVLGYSMGGRTALHFALRHGHRVAALILESAAPGYADPRERAARVRSDEELAGRIEGDGIEPFVDYWQSIPLWESQRGLPEATRAALRQQRLLNSALGLANSLRGMGAGAQEPVMHRLPELRMPVLFLAGGLDARYAALAREMAGLVPGAEARIIPGAGHAAHFERSDAFAAEVSRFLERCFTKTTGGVR
jgi:2-succinyl-6-hydroxy-2,4-cyclohexadiene-1-carboxylate synthase